MGLWAGRVADILGRIVLGMEIGKLHRELVSKAWVDQKLKFALYILVNFFQILLRIVTQNLLNIEREVDFAK